MSFYIHSFVYSWTIRCSHWICLELSLWPPGSHYVAANSNDSPNEWNGKTTKYLFAHCHWQLQIHLFAKVINPKALNLKTKRKASYSFDFLAEEINKSISSGFDGFFRHKSLISWTAYKIAKLLSTHKIPQSWWVKLIFFLA